MTLWQKLGLEPILEQELGLQHHDMSKFRLRVPFHAKK